MNSHSLYGSEIVQKYSYHIPKIGDIWFRFFFSTLYQDKSEGYDTSIDV